MTEKHHARRQAAATTEEPGKPAVEETPAAVYEHVEEPASDSPHPSPLPEGEGIDVQAELEAERAKANDYLEQWRRTAADFSNFKRRNELERAEMAKLFNESLVRALLPVLDNFERALASMPEEYKANGWSEGVSLTEKQLRAALEKEGLSGIEAVGQKFDPNLHEAVAHDVSDEHQDDSVIEEFQRGYKLHDRVIRPSMVKVSRRN